jgi:hypothetical protein
MTDITQIQDKPDESQFIVPADGSAAQVTSPEGVKIDETAPTDENTEFVQTPEEAAAAKAAAREAFARRRAEREAKASAEEVVALRAQVETLSAAKKTEVVVPAADAPKRPNPADYDLGRWDAKYEADLTKYQDDREAWIIAQAEAKAMKVTEGLTANQAEAQELHNLNQKGDEVGKRGIDKYADFEEVVQDALEAMPPAPEALKELVQLPNAEDVFYHLAQHPDELDKITAMTPMGQALEFGKISARLAVKAKVAQNVTKAKPSPQPPRGEGGKFATESDAAYDKLLQANRNPWN